jgi:hypothetical protein
MDAGCQPPHLAQVLICFPKGINPAIWKAQPINMIARRTMLL